MSALQASSSCHTEDAHDEGQRTYGDVVSIDDQIFMDGGWFSPVLQDGGTSSASNEDKSPQLRHTWGEKRFTKATLI